MVGVRQIATMAHQAAGYGEFAQAIAGGRETPASTREALLAPTR
jgi:hypothetical protein